MMKTKYQVYFQEAEKRLPLMRYLKKNCSHCFLVKVDEINGLETATILENAYPQVTFGMAVHEPKVLNEFIKFLHPEATCIEIELDQADENQKIIWEPITCVTLTKKALGLKKFRIQTPKQLRDELLRMGGKFKWVD